MRHTKTNPNTTLNKETKMAPSAELQTAQSDFAKTFAAFKDANDQRLSEIEAKHSPDTLLTDKVERLNTALDQQTRQIERLSIHNARPQLGASDGNPEAKSAWSSYIRTGDGSALMSLEGKSLTSVDAGGRLYRAY